MKYYVMCLFAVFAVAAFLPEGASASDFPGDTITDNVVVEQKFRKKIFDTGSKQVSEDAPSEADLYSVKFIIASEVRYEIIKETNIFDENNKSLTINELPVPCEATIEYQRVAPGTNNLLSLKIIRKKTPSTQKWSQFPPE